MTDTIVSRIDGVSIRAYRNIVRATIRDPTRALNPLDFATLEERELLCFNLFGDKGYEAWLDSGKFPAIYQGRAINKARSSFRQRFTQSLIERDDYKRRQV